MTFGAIFRPEMAGAISGKTPPKAMEWGSALPPHGVANKSIAL